MATPEHQAKYQKLATEYSKVRAQNQVLKKAVIEEQQKTSKQSDLLQSLRKAEQENDSLNFRNQQLTCRLTLLQDDLHQLQGKPGKKGSIGVGGKGEDNASIHSSDGLDVEVLVQELQAKISENAALHARVADMEQGSDEREARQLQLEQLGPLQHQNRELAEQLKSSMEALDLHERTTKAKLEQLQSEGVSSSITIQQQTKHISKLKHQLVMAQQQQQQQRCVVATSSSSCGEAVSSPLHHSSSITTSPISPSSPTSSSSLSYVSVAPYFSSLATPLSSSATNRDCDSLATTTLDEDDDATTISSSASSQIKHDDDDYSSNSISNAAKPGGGSGATLHPDTLRLDLPQKTTPSAASAPPPVLPIPLLSKELCLRFNVFITLLCQCKKRKIASGGGGVIEGDAAATKALDTISKVEQGVAYWDKLAPLLETVMRRTIGGVGLSSNGAVATTINTATTNNSDSIVGSISTTTASTLAHLRLVSSIPATPGFQSAMRSVQSSWSAILPYLSALSANSNRTHSLSTLIRLVGLLADRCSGLYTALDDAYTKWLLEEKDEQDAVVGEALMKLARTTETLVKVLKSNLEIGVVQNAQLTAAESSTSFNVLGQEMNSNPLPGAQLNGLGRNNNHLQGGLTSSPPSPTSLSSPDESNLSSNASVNVSSVSGGGNELSTARLAQLHRQREHWRLEYHLLSHKYSKLMKVLKDRKNYDKTLNDDAETASSNIDQSKVVKILPSSLLGEAEMVGEEHTSGDCKQEIKVPKVPESSDTESWRESMIRHHLTSRCSKLFLELSTMTSKATLFQDECEAALERVREGEAVCSGLESDLDTVREERNSIAEELRTTCTNYEEQISAMSDHLADVNEKIAAHEDQAAMNKFLGKKNKK